MGAPLARLSLPSWATGERAVLRFDGKGSAVSEDLNLKNEAELQAHVEARLRAALPFLPVQVQFERHLHLHLGHHKIVIDGMSSTAGGALGRYDVLVRAEGKPLLILELKAPDVGLTKDDLAQALSYARLHEPMVPLVVLTNGVAFQFCRTFDASELKGEDLAAQTLATTLAAAVAMATAASENAVRTLLGANRSAWTQILANWSRDNVESMTGDVREFQQPIVRDFVIEREAAKSIVECLENGAKVVALHGPPLSGVTNTLVQTSKDPALAPSAFMEGVSGDVLQVMANRLTRELKFGVSRDDVRAWLNTTGSLMGLTLIVDGFPSAGLDELIENAAAGVLRLVVGSDSETVRRAVAMPGRSQASPFGRAAKLVELGALSDDEFALVHDVFERTFGALFFNGAQHAVPLRWPHRLRVLAGTLPSKAPSAAAPAGFVQGVLMAPIPGPGSLEEIGRAFADDPEVKVDLGLLARAYLKNVEARASNPDWLASTWGRLAVDPALLEKELGEDRVRRLRSQGFLSWVSVQNGSPQVLIRVEELLAHHVADEWANSLAAAKDPGAMSAELERHLGTASAMPGGEVALAAAIMRASTRNEALLGVLIPVLVKREPVASRLGSGAVIDVLVKEGSFRVHFGEGMDEEFFGEVLPWVVLSHLAALPISSGEEETVNFAIFAVLGRWPHLLFQPPLVEFARVPGFHFHEVPGVGSVPCLNTGIVEPLLQSMVGHAHHFPKEFVKLANLALENREAHLAWRVLTAALAARTSVDPEVAAACEGVVNVLQTWWAAGLQAARSEVADP
jgi:hypothetical protein